ncbi:unnamed protein product [Phyllotreta striolata]|uniref:Insulin receptor substrate 1 n=1 Tax=Phyllotreta striolata TaxID=444603 RepID=A0A9N9XRW4_PHYSR|nr:unnamed protein product [Phyllotreta striolata]
MSHKSSAGCGGRGAGEVLLAGPLKKLKTSRKKWFVLRAETLDSSARLEYYDSEKKFNDGRPPKRSIQLKTCFNINRRHDTRHKHVIALYTKDDCFCVVLDTEEELESWLRALLALQHGEEAGGDGEAPKPTFEHVWQVTILNKGLGTGRTGNYRLCLTDKTLCLVKKDCNNSILNLNLSNIRSCGSLRNYFFLENGRSSLLGAGELWMESEDATIAQNIHTTIFHAMSTNSKHDEMRTRSSSETSKTANNRKQIATKTSFCPISNACVGNASQGGIPSGNPGTTISHQRTQSLPLTDHPSPIIQANCNVAGDDYAPFHPPARTHVVTTTTATSNVNVNVNKTRSNATCKCIERCDSMPSSRSRTASEGASWRPFWPQRRDIPEGSPTGQCCAPMSPASVGCSTDSAGSSYSLADEAELEPSGHYNAGCSDDAIVEEERNSDDGYVDMSPGGRRGGVATRSSPTGSVVSGTPSTDARFSEFPLDKIVSYLTSDDDAAARPTRTYSVGTKPDAFKARKQQTGGGGGGGGGGGAGDDDGSRDRSCSVGAKNKRVTGRMMSMMLGYQQHKNLKSISAPLLLSNARSYGSHSSFDPNDDFLVMDFSNHGGESSTTTTDGSSSANNGYVKMKPGVEVLPKKPEVSPYVDMSGSSYMEMGGSSPSSRQDECTSFVDISRQYKLSSSSSTSTNNNYMDMDSRKHKPKPSTSPRHNADYFECGPSSHPYERNSSFSSSSQPSSSPRNADYLSMNFSPSERYNPPQQQQQQQQQQQPKTPEDYVEMSAGGRHQKQGSLDGAASSNEDYVNMSVGSKKKGAKTSASTPISIHQTNPASQVIKHSSSPISISSLLGRKSSSGTPPKHLSLTSWSSLPRQRSRDSATATTPTGGSPSAHPMASPLRSTPDAGKRPLSSYRAKSPPSGNSPSSTGDYAMIDFASFRHRMDGDKEKENLDYVNYAPMVGVETVDRSKEERKKDSYNDDYAVMQPGSRILDGRGGGSLDTSPLIGPLSSIGLDFRPIDEDAATPTPTPVNVKDEDSMDYAEFEPAVAASSNSECVSPAAKMSRPNSVNSDPSSTEGVDKKLHYASLDLAMADDESRSPGGGNASTASAASPTFVYAEIDFVKSEDLKHQNNNNNNNNNQSLGSNNNAKVKN